MRRLFALSLAVIFYIVITRLHASEGGDDLVALAKSGADQAAMVAHIQKSPIAYDLTVSEILFLNDLQIEPDVITAAINQGKRKRGEPVQEGPAPKSAGYGPIVKLIKAGLDENIVLGLIGSSPTAYDLTVDEILSLNKMGAPVKVIDCAVSVGKTLRTKAAKELNEALDQYKLRDVIKNPPQTTFVIRDKTNKEFTLNKWLNDTAVAFTLNDASGRIRTFVASEYATAIAEYKTEEYKVEGPSGGVETRVRVVCIAPEKVRYEFKGKTILAHYIFYEFSGGDKGVYSFKQGSLTIGPDAYEIVSVRNAAK